MTLGACDGRVAALGSSAATAKRARSRSASAPTLAGVEGDPAADPTAIEHMPLVFKAGVVYRTHVIFDGLKGAIGLH